MLVAPVDVHASAALVLVVELAGAEVRVTVGDGAVGTGLVAAITAQVVLALAEPFALLTVTVNVCVPTARPE